eukprot:g2069.t1
MSHAIGKAKTALRIGVVVLHREPLVALEDLVRLRRLLSDRILSACEDADDIRGHLEGAKRERERERERGIKTESAKEVSQHVSHLVSHVTHVLHRVDESGGEARLLQYYLMPEVDEDHAVAIAADAEVPQYHDSGGGSGSGSDKDGDRSTRARKGRQPTQLVSCAQWDAVRLKSAVVLLSRRFLASADCALDLVRAHKQGQVIIPVILKNCCQGDANFQFPGGGFYEQTLAEMYPGDQGAQRMLKAEGVSAADIVTAFKAMLLHIGPWFDPSASHRELEIAARKAAVHLRRAATVGRLRSRIRNSVMPKIRAAMVLTPDGPGVIRRVTKPAEGGGGEGATTGVAAAGAAAGAGGVLPPLRGAGGRARRS